MSYKVIIRDTIRQLYVEKITVHITHFLPNTVIMQGLEAYRGSKAWRGSSWMDTKYRLTHHFVSLSSVDVPEERVMSRTYTRMKCTINFLVQKFILCTNSNNNSENATSRS